LKNWARWEREKPSWFTPKLKASVPDEYIPGEHLVALGGEKRVRRGSAAGSVRESFRMIEAEVVGVGRDEEEKVVVFDDDDEEEVEGIEDVEEVDSVEKIEVVKGDINVEEDKEVMVEEEVREDIMNDVD
jgi:hypothetical protein